MSRILMVSSEVARMRKTGGLADVVSAVGGLNDTIEEGTGFKFSEHTGPAQLAAIRKAGQAPSQPEL